MAFAARAANSLWLLSQAPEYLRYLSAAAHPRNSQVTLLQGYLARNAGTEFGRRHGFAKLRGPGDFAQAVPLQDWESLRPWVERAAGLCDPPSSAPRGAVLCADPVDRLEPTSGSSSAAKFIPVTSRLRGEISRAVAAWMWGLFRAHPAAFSGTAYWSVSPPVMTPPALPGSALPVGHAPDTEYLDPVSAFLMRRTLAVPESAAAAGDAESFYRETLARLLADAGLSLFSVWSPAFLLQLDARLRDSAESLLRHAADRRFASPARIRALESSLRPGFRWSGIWPRLAAVSCWTHAQSATWLPRVCEVIGKTSLHSKGLMATEGATSIPSVPGKDPCLAVRSHYFEFLPEGSDRALQVHELDLDGTYEVILTTGGGLWRYRTGDVVRVTDFHQALPCLRFLGRSGRVSDLVGEKMSEVHAQTAIGRMPAPPRPVLAAFLHPGFAEGRATYVIYLELSEPPPPAPEADRFADAAAQAVENSLSENPYYRQARALGQLAAAQARFLKPGASLRLADLSAASGRAAMAKVPALFPAGTLSGFLEGEACRVS